MIQQVLKQRCRLKRPIRPGDSVSLTDSVAEHKPFSEICNQLATDSSPGQDFKWLQEVSDVRRCWSVSISQHVYTEKEGGQLEYPLDELSLKLFLAIWGHGRPHAQTRMATETRTHEEVKLNDTFDRLCRFNRLSKLTNTTVKRVGCLHVYSQKQSKNFDTIDRCVYMKRIVDRAADRNILGYSLQKFLKKMCAHPFAPVGTSSCECAPLVRFAWLRR